MEGAFDQLQTAVRMTFLRMNDDMREQVRTVTFNKFRQEGCELVGHFAQMERC